MPKSEADRPSVRWRVARSRPSVLAIGGFDPSGGAGILMDARAISAAGAHPTALVTALTIQSTAGCVDVAPVDAETFRSQLEHLVSAQPPLVVKLGALGSADIAQIVANYLAESPCLVVLDPVAAPSVHAGNAPGRPLATDAARAIVRNEILPRGVLLCANGMELEALSGLKVVDTTTAIAAARVVIEHGARAVYAKSGHWPTTDANDVIVFRDTTCVLPAPRLDASDVHGTGCTLASLWAGRLAFAGDTSQGSIADAARWAKGFLFRALESAIVVGDGQRVVRLDRD